MPQLYWRLGTDVELAEDTPEGLQQAFGYMQRLDEAQAVDDAAAALEHLRAMPGTAGKAGVLGFCMGGRLAYKLAAASDAVILSFNVRPVGDARAVADREGVEIRHYAVIYRAIDELRNAMQGMLAPEEVEETIGSAEVWLYLASVQLLARRLARSGYY